MSAAVRPMDPASVPNGRRLAAICAIVLAHVLLVLGWQRPPGPAPVQADVRSTSFVWIDLPPMPRAVPVRPPKVPQAAAAKAPDRPATRRATTPRPITAADTRPDAIAVPAGASVQAGASPAETAADESAAPSAHAILERARRDAGAIDRALRKENNAVIVAPPDSPQLRLKRGIDDAAELAPNAVWQAPKTADLVNQTADGARRTRVITGRGTYCITERSPITAIETIERHGRTRITNCPQHETPARKQLWKTARD